MPKVGNKSFPYTERGEGQAEVYAAQTSQPITREEKDSYGYGTYQKGGSVKPGIFDFAWNKYEQGDDTYKRAQQDLYLQDKKYWDSKEAHREYLDAIKNDAEQSPEFMVMDVILKGLSSKIANSLDNTEQPLTMAKDLLRFTEGDANKAAEMAAQINYEFSSTAPENSAVGDYWDYWTRKLPEIYKPNKMQRGGSVKDSFGYGSYQEGGFFTEIPDMFSKTPDMFSGGFPKMMTDEEFEKNKRPSTKEEEAWATLKSKELREKFDTAVKAGYQDGGPVKRYGY